MSRWRAGAAGVALLGSAVLVVVAGATPAQAHKHPTPVELDAPAVVQVRTDALVNISLIEHNRQGKHIGLFQASYTIPLANASGFAVDPTGAVVTTSRVVNVDLLRANVFAINTLFHDRYGARAPLPSDPYARTSIRETDPNDPLNARLQRCYQSNTADTTGGCVVATSRQVTVLPFVNDQKVYGNLVADVLFPRASDTTNDVAVLRVGASSMPTVRLASTLGTAPYAALGFVRTPSNGASESNMPGHFEAAGKAVVKRDETYPAQLKALRAGTDGGPVVGETGEVVGFLKANSKDITLVGPDKLRAALKAAGVVPHSGPTDTAYEAASHNFKNALYTAALPSLLATLKLYPGHALANENAVVAKAKAGTAEDKTGTKDTPAAPASRSGKSDSGNGVLVPGLIAGGAIALLGLLWLLLRRRPRKEAAPAATAAPTPPPAPLPGPVVDLTTPVPPVDARPEQELTIAGQRQAGPAPAATPTSARARAGATAGPSEQRSRARAAATNAGPVLDLTDPTGVVDDGQTASLSALRPCRVCGEPTSPAGPYCESCGYPLT